MNIRKISVVIIAFNEERNIARCIRSVRKIADDVVVVDSHSTDRTREIALAEGARVVEHTFEGHVQQKNWAITQAKYPFILSLDADEYLSETLIKSIDVIKGSGLSDGYTVNRLNFYCGKPIKTCGWYPDKKLRLWNSEKGRWKGTNPHDRFSMQDGSRIKLLKGDLLHDTYPTKEDFLRQVDNFATISAKHHKHKNLFFLIYKMIFSPPFKFFKNYIYNLGYIEGFTGIYICFNQAREVFLKYNRAIRFKYAS